MAMKIQDLSPGDRFHLTAELGMPPEFRSLYQFKGMRDEDMALVAIVRDDGTVGKPHPYRANQTVQKA